MFDAPARPRLVAAQGAPTWWLDKHRPSDEKSWRADQERRQRALRWVRGLYTREGNRRDVRLALCGRVVLSQTQGAKLRWAKMSCGDRFCPSCQKRRSAEISEQLRAAFRADLEEAPVDRYGNRVVGPARAVSWSEYSRRSYFVTLTQVQVPGESARGAVDRLLATWRELTSNRTTAGRQWARKVSGAIRTVEVTQGRHGWHAHIHAVVVARSELSEASFRGWVIPLWLRTSPGTSSDGQDVQRVDPGKLGQLCKYVVKPIIDADDMDERSARRLAYALVGRRMMQGTGNLLSWRAAGVAQLAAEHLALVEAGEAEPRDPVSIVFHTLPVGRVWKLAKWDRWAAKHGGEPVTIPGTGRRAWDVFWDAEALQQYEQRYVPMADELLPPEQVAEPPLEQLHFVGVQVA